MVKKFSKIGSLEYKGYKTDFYVMPKTKAFLEKQKISLACLIPNAWLFYEVDFFEHLHKNKFGKKFKTIYYGVLTKLGWEEGELKEYGFKDNFKEDLEIDKSKIIMEKNLGIDESPQRFLVKYVVLKN